MGKIFASSAAACLFIVGALAVASPANAAEATFDDVPGTVPIDIDDRVEARTIPVTGVESLTGISVMVDFQKSDSTCVAIGTGYAYVDEVGFTLTSPAGTTVKLVLTSPDTPSYLDWSAPAVPRAEVVLDDNAATLVGVGGVPESGTFQPAEPLSAFIGEDPEGDWTLSAIDSVGGDSLCYYGASLRLTDASVTPDPDNGGQPVIPGNGDQAVAPKRPLLVSTASQ